MTEPSEAAMAKADELRQGRTWHETLCSLIQEVSDAAKVVNNTDTPFFIMRETLAPFILPEPVDPHEAFARALYGIGTNDAIGRVQDALTYCGLKIVEDKP